MNPLVDSPLAQDIGTTLVHSLWQIVLLAVVFAVVNRLLTKRSANSRYVVAYAALVLMLVMPLLTLLLVRSAEPSSKFNQDQVAEFAPQVGHSFPVNVATPVIDDTTTSPQLPIEKAEVGLIASPLADAGSLGSPPGVESQMTSEWSLILPWLSVAWSLGVIAFSIRPFLALHRCRQIRKQAQPVMEPWIADSLESLCDRLGLKRKVEVASSTLVHVPAVIGFLRPIVLLPLSMLSGQTPCELSAIIAHELAHNPVVGATIEMGYMNAPKGETLDDWLKAVRSSQSIAMAARHVRGFPAFSAGRWQGIVTDSHGQFRMTGIGRERQLRLHVRHPNIVAQTVSVVTRQTEPVAQPAYDSSRSHNETTYGARFECAIAPSRSYEGIVKDAKTGEPIAGVEIWSDKFSGQSISGTHTIKIKSDENGHYRLEGMPKGDGNEIVVVPVGLPYFTAVFELPDPAGLEPAKMDIELHRGVWVSGRVTDGKTDAPVAARMHYMAPPDHPLAAELPEFDYGTHAMRVQDRYRTDRNGNYRVVALPGRALVGVNVLSGGYPTGQGHEEIADRENRNGYVRFNGAFGPTKRGLTAVKELVISEGGVGNVCDFPLKAGKSVALRVTDPTGQPLAGVAVNGTRGISDGYRTMSGDQFEISALSADETRTILLKHDTRGLGRAMHVAATGNKSRPIRVQLEPYAKVIGRLLKDGNPIPAQRLRFDIWQDGSYGQRIESVSTDEQGQFTHEAVLPGLPYAIYLEGSRVDFKVITEKLDISSGETVDLGTIDVSSDERPSPVRTTTRELPNSTVAVAANDKTQIVKPPSEAGPTTIHIAGQVLGPDEEPFSGAKLFVSYHAKEYTKPRVMVESGDDGRFQFDASPQQFGEILGDVQVVAMAPGYGLDWTNLFDEQNKTRDLMLRLIPDAPIEGKVMDLEGLPVAGATVEINTLRATPQENLDPLLKNWKRQDERLRLIAARDQLVTKRLMWPRSIGLASTKTDASGTFRLSGYGKDRWLGLLISGPRIAKEYVIVLARPKAEVESLAKIKRPFAPTFGTQFEYTASPSKPIVGTVRDSATKGPIAGARVYRRNVNSITDANGRYRLDGVAKADRYWVGVKSDTHFLARAEKGDTPGFNPITIDLEVDRGVALHVRLRDKSTGRPVRGSFAYYAAVGNASVEGTAFAEEPYSGTLGETGPDGTGTMVVYPGPGYLCVRASENRFVPEYPAAADNPVPLQQIKAIPNGFDVGLYHIIKKIDPRQGAKALHLDIELDPGTTIAGRVTGGDGEALDDVMFAGKTPLREWGGLGFETLQSPSFSVVGLHETPRTVLFIQREKQLAKSVEISGQPPATPTVMLEPLGTLIGQVVDETGNPRTSIVVQVQVRGHEAMTGFGLPKPRIGSLAHTLWGDMHLRNQVLNRSAEVDAAGRFRIEGLVSGLTYDLYSLVDGKLLALTSKITISPKKTRDVGAIRLRPMRQ